MRELSTIGNTHSAMRWLGLYHDILSSAQRSAEVEVKVEAGGVFWIGPTMRRDLGCFLVGAVHCISLDPFFTCNLYTYQRVMPEQKP